jgi:SAM-dependent methyltransferase
MADVRSLNRSAWDAKVARKNPWTIPVSAEEIAAARHGQWRILLTPTRAAPSSWFPQLRGSRVLCLASGGGQQGPILAAAGARVTVLDNSPKQLAQDRMVAHRDDLELELVEGDMADLGCFEDETFDLIVHPISNCFVPTPLPVWTEAFRVLKEHRDLLAGFTNPVRYLFDDHPDANADPLRVVFSIPYSDLDSRDEAYRRRQTAAEEPFEFGHSLEDQIGGQIAEGFVITGFYEDVFPPEKDVLSRYIPSFAATRATKTAR